MTRPPHVVKAVDGGNGWGYGDGWGSGYGWGDGGGDGSGSGWDDGGGDGSDWGSGSGSGRGNTARWLDTSHPTHTAGWHKLLGGAASYKVLP